MTFGLGPASNIAQQFAEAIVAMWRKLMQEAEVPYLWIALQSLPHGWHHVVVCIQLQHSCSQCSSTLMTPSSSFWEQNKWHGASGYGTVSAVV